jgi:hypothetical protein
MPLLEKIAASLYQGLDVVPDQLAVLSYGVPHEDGHHLHDVDHQQGDGVVGGFVDITPTNTAEVQKATVGRQAAWICKMGINMPHAA